MLTTKDKNRFYLIEGYERTCDYCGKVYTAKRETSRFCSPACRVYAHNKAKKAREVTNEKPE
jgi:hypothetical protein